MPISPLKAKNVHNHAKTLYPNTTTMKTIYLHIGLHKTATTSIQVGLEQNRIRLKRAGWHIPLAGKIYWRNAGQHNIPPGLMEYPRFARHMGTADDLVREIQQSPEQNFIVSSEVFCHLREPMVERLGSLLSPFNVVVIVYLRRQDEFLQSVWAEQVGSGVCMDNFSSWLQGPRRHLWAQDARSSYLTYLSMWADVFGEDALRVRVFENGQLEGHVFHDFLMACDVPDVTRFRTPRRQHSSPDIKTLEMIRHMVAKTDSDPHLSNMEIARAIRRYSNLVGWNSERLNLIDRAHYEQIMGQYTSSNEVLAERFLGREWLFLADFEPQPITRFDAAELPEREMKQVEAFVGLATGSKGHPISTNLLPLHHRPLRILRWLTLHEIFNGLTGSLREHGVVGILRGLWWRMWQRP